LNIRHGGNVFAIARERGWDWREVLDFSASINPIGPSPKVRPAIENAIARIVHYPDGGAHALAEALAAEWRVPAAFIMPGNGATELLHFFARAGWQGPTALVAPVFSEFHRAFPRALRARLDDPDRWPQRGLLVLSQPVNPTGELMPSAILRRAVASREGPVLIDESFIDFTGEESAVTWCRDHPNLLVLRSLTKFHALPGLRVGALVTSAAWMNRLRARREPWQVNVLAEAAAIAALSDHEHAQRTRQMVAAEREWLRQQIEEWPGVRLSNSSANFLFAELDRKASAVVEHFLNQRILVRDCTGTPGVSGEAIRFAVRLREENERFVAVGKELVCAVS